MATVIGDLLIPLTTSLPTGADVAAIEADIERQRNRSRSGEGFQFVIVDNESDRAVGQIGLTFRDHAGNANGSAALAGQISALPRG